MCTWNSCTMLVIVYGICMSDDVYVLLNVKPEEVHVLMRIYKVHTCTPWQTMVQPEAYCYACLYWLLAQRYQWGLITWVINLIVQVMLVSLGFQNKLVNPLTIVSYCFEYLLALMRHLLAATTKHYLSQLWIVQQYTDTPISLIRQQKCAFIRAMFCH